MKINKILYAEAITLITFLICIMVSSSSFKKNLTIVFLLFSFTKLIFLWLFYDKKEELGSEGK